ncbi:GNAT family N-acetyltransferase [Streptomyces sp. NPDC053048]|uniref:GNAT family N-acetyltransferase n=1 Tax=Streptomyces sp. NPDC053048 TaxID=3365694 RepID=UPI0037D4B231
MAVPDRPLIPTPAPSAPCYVLSLARGGHEVREAQRLRYRMFAEEAGRHLETPQPGHDIDGFDAYCDHLLARDARTGTLVGTCRLLTPEGAEAAGGLVAEEYFDLDRLAALRGDLVEVSRACTHPAHRGGTLIPLMTLGVGHYVVRARRTWIGGSCLLSPDGDLRTIAAVWETAVRHLAPEEYRVTPLMPVALPREPVAAREHAALPPLLRGSLDLGAWVCGPPGHNPRWGAAALYVLTPLHRIDPAHLRDLPVLAPDRPPT